MSEMNALPAHAIAYAALGWRVFPLKPGGKEPITRHGVKDATAEEAQIRDWWDRWPNANIGLACGAVSGVYAIDIDFDEEKGINGYESLKQLGELPATVVQSTPRGGRHFFYATGNAPANKNGLRPGIDIRGDGYYVVLAPSIHPNGGTYQWVDGYSPWEVQPVEYPDFMRVERERVTPPPASPSAATQAPKVHNSLDLERRAIAYLDACPPAISGQGGHAQTFEVTQALVRGFGLSDDTAFMLLATRYNPRCVEQWSEKELRHKVESARKNPCDKPEGWLRDSAEYAPATGPPVEIDYEALIAKASAPESPAVKTEKKSDASLFATLPDEFRRLTGWIGEYIGFCMKNSPHPNWPLAFAGGLALASAVTGRKFVSPSGIATNLYVLGLAMPGTGKDFTRKLNAGILAEAGRIDILAEKFASAEGIEDKLSQTPVVLYQPDEADSVITTFSDGRDGRGAAIGAMITQLYTSATSMLVPRTKAASADKAEVEPITRPHLSMLATATPKLFYEALGPRTMTGGFLARTLALQADPRSPRNPGGIVEPPESLVSWVRECLDYIPPGTGDLGEVSDKYLKSYLTVPVSSGGKYELERCGRKADTKFREAELESDVEAAALWSRVYEQTEKIATILALSNNIKEPEVGEREATLASEIVIHSARQSMALMGEYSGDSQFARECQKFLRAVKGRERATRGYVLKRMKISAADLDKIVFTMIERQEIAQIYDRGESGRASVVYKVL